MRWRQIFLLVAFFFPMLLFAQEIKNLNPVIKIVAGEPFYIHEVRKGQSLESIARAYASTVVAIEEENPALTDPLILGINIRIPYTDESAARMMQVAEEMELIESSEARNAREQRRQEMAKKEAARLIESKMAKRPDPNGEASAQADALISEETGGQQAQEDTPVEGPTTEEMALLKELTDSVSESLVELEEVKEEIEDTPYLDKDGLPKREPFKLKEPTVKVEPKGTSLVDLIDEVTKGFEEGDSLSYLRSLFMREYFLVRVNPEGVITNVRDERTLTNANTRVLRIDDIKGRYLSENMEEFALQIVPVGLNVHLDRREYPVKVKKGKVKPLSPSITEDALDPGGEHFAFISKDAKLKDLKGKFVIEMVEGDHYLSIHDQFEYNPFGVTLEEVAKEKVITIVSIEER